MYYILQHVGEWHFLEDQLGKAIQEPLVVVGGGRLVVGQDLDIPDGGFSISQSLHAEIADFLLYDVALTAPEMITFMSCQQNITHDPVIYLDGNGTVLRAVGETEVSRVSETQVCEKAEGYTLLFPERMNFYEAVIWCGTLQGSVALPRSKKENEEIHDRFQRFNDVCLDGWGTIYYLGAVGNSTTEKWSAVVDGGPLTWDNFDPGWNKPTNGYTCSSVGSHIFPYIWFSAPCNNKMCALCNFRSHPELRIRGLCTSSLFDRIFYLHDYENDRPAFDGLEQSRIYWNNDTWVMESRVHEGLRALMVAVRTQEYPLGLHTWAIHQDKCHQPQVELLLTSCGRDDYTCNSGACISKRRRCDLITDCSDLSDEFDCDVIYTPSGYSAALPPPKLSSEPLPLFFSLTITSIREFNLVEFTLVLDAIVSLRWHDSRLIFRNLQEDFRANKVKDPSRVWQPGVFIRDGTRGAVDAQPRSQALFVVLGGQTLADDDAVVAEGAQFRGFV
nr:uncharacterized protein LOC123769256 [Procambarus clarkii]